MPVLSLQVANDANDANYFASGTAQVTGDNYIVIGNSSGTSCHHIARFQNVNIPQGSTISSALVSLYISGFSYAGSNISFKGHCENADNSTLWPTSNDATSYTAINGKALTTGVVFTQTTPPTSGYRTLELGTEFQTVINRTGFAANNAISVLFKENSNASGNYFSVHGWAWSGVSTAMKVDITYTAAVASSGDKNFRNCMNLALSA